MLKVDKPDCETCQLREKCQNIEVIKVLTESVINNIDKCYIPKEMKVRLEISACYKKIENN